MVPFQIKSAGSLCVGMHLIWNVALTLRLSLQELVDYLRRHSHSAVYASAMSPAITEQIIRAMKCITGKDGSTEGTSSVEILTTWGKFHTLRVFFFENDCETQPANDAKVNIEGRTCRKIQTAA